jgi:hypothetical protein
MSGCPLDELASALRRLHRRVANQALMRFSWRFPERWCLQVKGACLPGELRKSPMISEVVHMPLSCATGSSLIRSSGPLARQALGSSFTPGRLLAGESAYLCCRDAE